MQCPLDKIQISEGGALRRLHLFGFYELIKTQKHLC